MTAYYRDLRITRRVELAAEALKVHGGIDRVLEHWECGLDIEFETKNADDAIELVARIEAAVLAVLEGSS